MSLLLYRSSVPAFERADYLVHFVIPNFYFHLTTAYDILRAAGLEIGKRSFLAPCPP